MMEWSDDLSIRAGEDATPDTTRISRLRHFAMIPPTQRSALLRA